MPAVQKISLPVPTTLQLKRPIELKRPRRITSLSNSPRRDQSTPLSPVNAVFRNRISLPLLILIPLLMLGLGTAAATAAEKTNSGANQTSIPPNERDFSNEVWFPQRGTPKLTTPQWVGDEGVECVVVFAIDDMRDPARYEAYLRPILQRLKQIDGRAPVSIMTCAVKPDDAQLQSWLQEGLSIECHTFDHPCPLLAGGDLAKSKATYDRCVDLLGSIPHNRPVAFRTPCCDSLNTVSPRFFSEIFNRTTPAGNFLQLDSSVFTLYTANDPSLPRDQLYDSDGAEKFRKYIPRKLARGSVMHDQFVNTIENYPYPYVIQNTCWEFPCMVPSDWSANHLHKPNNPDTVRDLKIALDLTVLKQGVMNLVFHPHGWIQAEQVVELIDHAVATHGRKVKFLNFNECVARLNANLLGGRSLRTATGQDQGLRLVPTQGGQSWQVVQLAREDLAKPKPVDEGRRQVDLDGDGHLDLIVSNGTEYGVWLYDTETERQSLCLRSGRRSTPPGELELPPILRQDGSENGFFVRDRHLCWINEETDHLPDLLRRIAFDDLLGDRLPEAKSPEAELKLMHVQPGYRIDLMAHEPLTMDPVAFDWGPDGKLWVVEMADYPQGMDGQGAPGGRIRYLEDLDGDGHYDKSTLFLAGIPFPSGVLAWKKGVLISAAPDLIYAEDTDGDGKADLQEVLYSGFGEGNQQHRVNGFTRGLDNWLYLANGDSGGAISSIKTGEKLDLRGRDLRIRPATGEMEAIAGATQFGRHRDDWGNWFGNNNSRPMWHFQHDDHYLRRNPFLAVPNLLRDVSVAPGAAPVFPTSKTLARFNDFHTANRFTSACSAVTDRDQVLFGTRAAVTGTGQPNDDSPQTMHTFVSEPVHNLVHHEVMTSDGYGFTSARSITEHQSEFVSCTDNWFRPTMLRTGPDGGLWIADMYRLVIEHPQWIPIEWQRKLNLRAGEDKGRLWRVLPIGTQPRAVPRLDQLSTRELVGQLDSQNGWQRDLVQQLLMDRADPASIPLLRAQARNSSNALCRLHSLCTLDGLARGLSVDLLIESVADVHPGVRRHAVRLLEAFASRADDQAAVQSLQTGIVSNPVRGDQALDQRVLKHLSPLIDDPDPQVRLQLAYSLGEFQQSQAGDLLGQLACRATGETILLTAVMSSLSRDHLADVLTAVARDPAAPAELWEQLLGQATAFEHEPTLVTLLLKVSETSKDQNLAAWQFSAVNQFLAALARRGQTLNEWLQKLGPDARQVETRLQSVFAAARDMVRDETLPLNERIAAGRVLGQSEGDLAVLTGLLTPQQPPELQSVSLASLGRLKSPEIATLLLAGYRSLGPGVRAEACSILLSREDWRDQLLEAIETKRLVPTDLDASSRQRLLVHANKKVRDRAAKVLAVDLNTDRVKLVGAYLPTVRAGGDAQHGSQLFVKRCAQCHKLGEIGHAVGPDLVSLTDKSAEALITAVLDPNRAVEAKFLTYTAITKAGVSYNGILATETASSVTLRAAEGKEVTLLRNEIDELQGNTKSLMPEGLERELTPADAAALIAYIRSNVPLPAMKSFPRNNPRVIESDRNGVLKLTPFEAEIYGPTIVIEEAHQNLGWWSSAEDLVVWTINVPQPGTYSVEWTWACDAQAAGNGIRIEALGKSITSRVRKTAGWDDYQTTKLGELELPAGEVRLTFKPTSRPLPALGDVKSVVLRRIP